MRILLKNASKKMRLKIYYLGVSVFFISSRVAMKIAWLEPRPIVKPFGNHVMYSISIIMIPNALMTKKSA